MITPPVPPGVGVEEEDAPLGQFLASCEDVMCHIITILSSTIVQCFDATLMLLLPNKWSFSVVTATQISLSVSLLFIIDIGKYEMNSGETTTFQGSFL